MRTDKYTGKGLKRQRERALLTQPELAEKIGVSVTTVWNWETGKKPPSLRHLRALKEFFEQKNTPSH